MKVKFGAIVTDGSGKLGGHVFSKNRGGNYMRTKVTPVNPRSLRQTAVRAIFAVISSAWSALSDAQRLSYKGFVDAYAKTNIFGDLKIPSAKALHQQLNQNLLNSEQAAQTTCPAPVAVPSAGLSAVDYDNVGNFLNVTCDNDTTGAKVVFFATPPMSQGTAFVKNKLRQIAVEGGGAGVTYDLMAAYVAKFGALVDGANYQFMVKVINTNGQASPGETMKGITSF